MEIPHVPIFLFLIAPTLNRDDPDLGCAELQSPLCNGIVVRSFLLFIGEILTIIRPRLTDHFGIPISQEKADFAIPFLDEDLPLYVDPFLLWKSPSQQDQALHQSMIYAFRSLITKGSQSERIAKLQKISECSEVGLGESATRRGVKIGQELAKSILEHFEVSKQKMGTDVEHIEEVQLFVDKVSKDRISDFACVLLKSFIVDFTLDQCGKYGIPCQKTTILDLYDDRKDVFKNIEVEVPINPNDGKPILFVPKRWLRFSPWIGYEDYFKNHYLKQYVEEGAPHPGRVEILNFNRDNYGVIDRYIKNREKSFADCKNDPLFSTIPVVSAKRLLAAISKLPSGKTNNADKKYEDQLCRLLPSLLYPHLDFAMEQSRTDSGAHIRDLVFYNNKSIGLLSDLWDKYSCRQIVFELKNVKELERDHINQINRYLKESFGSFGILVTRNEPTKTIQRNLIDLWSGQRKCILVLTDSDIDMMVNVFESKQRDPIEVINKKYVEFMRACPS
ncbi:MAG TPA: GxxExxY protein [Oligoflexus sp.]|uniref:GxxExxY protein n=1 Tax=Oligoflexus sp. TaxID=1971216 RepID=UPI002D7F20F7|nr:GxxExxY protein [Oligoflexus sp.]HET9236212.1 GxxExxY protein [Oligoflexus sp.]